MEDQERETTTEAEHNGLKEDELELNLGLRPVTIRRHFHPSNPNIPIPEGSGDLSLMTVPICGKGGGAGSEQDSEGLRFEFEAKREAHALRRQEARKKREEKRKSKANAVSGNSNGRVLWFEKQRAAGREREIKADLSKRLRKGKRNCNNNEAEGTVPAPATTSFLVRPPGWINGNQLNGVSYYMMMPGLVRSDGNTLQPVAGAGGAGGFRPYQVPGKNSDDGDGRGDNVKQSVSGCSRRSSSGTSDYRSTSGQGGSSSDGGSHSSHSHLPKPTTTNGPTASTNTKPQTANSSQSSAPQPNACTLNTKPDCTSSCNHTEPSQSLNTALNPEVLTETSPGKNPMPGQRSQSPSNEAKGVNPSKPPKPPAQQTNEAMLLSQMPYVSTTGNGPNGKTITGFLYKYTNSEVCIVCVCHGSSFTPAGFVEHAGGVEVENPLRHITVVPFAIT